MSALTERGYPRPAGVLTGVLTGVLLLLLRCAVTVSSKGKSRPAACVAAPQVPAVFAEVRRQLFGLCPLQNLLQSVRALGHGR